LELDPKSVFSTAGPFQHAEFYRPNFGLGAVRLRAVTLR
jgi:hypothetical protein